MAISMLLREAFVASPNFNHQVEGVVTEQALYKNTAWEQADKLNASTRQLLANVARQPQQYGFTRTIVSENSWSVTYDGWAADPASADYAILLGVQNTWLLLTGIDEPPDPVPPP